MITVTQLEYIVAVEQHKSFSMAADACFVTQPTLSMQIKKLEEYLGIVLFDRTKQPIIPTEVGKPIIEQARNTLREVNRIEEIVKQHQGIVSGDLTVGIIPTLAPYLLPRFAGPLTREYPEMRLYIKELQTEEIIRQLKQDQIDVGILVTPLHEDGIVETPLFYEDILVYTNPEYKFEDKKELSIEDLKSPDLWLLSKGHCFRDQVINLCAYQGQLSNNLPIAYESGSLETLMKLVDNEGGFTLLPELATDGMNEDLQNRIRTIKDLKPTREVSLVSARNFAKESMLEALAGTIKQVMPNEYLNPQRGEVVEWRG
ncbi:hydrogen peroxide-inducible genes activator [Sediminitomix flava]|uniref:LysR family hydrogen peroxide-inducible transcriptional activator n=1 Tax=Sediminitomix flava TaxID=379075 RepID=A0A315ZW49_SEDFL|nr:hydrogen peroxide-inducible genes activator [Sediminitomix flava]PWJ40903.1 LysR family hydrogen peroxide-inducible transcriptional activator [Sediminitomix flava]